MVEDTGGDGLLRLYRDRVRPEWLDYNGHMNDTFYLLILSRASDAFMKEIGLDPRSEERKVTSMYTLESHLRYLQEAAEGTEVEVTTQLLDHDAKRVQLFHSMYDLADGRCLATAEILLMHVDMTGPKPAPFADAVGQQLARIAAAQAGLPRPEAAGRAVAIRR